MKRKTIGNYSAFVRGKINRVVAACLAILLVITATDSRGLQYVSAAEESKVDIITGFAALPAEAASQQLLVGASEAEIILPTSLSVISEVYDVDTALTVSGGAIAISGSAIRVNPNYNLTEITWQIDESQSSSAAFDSSTAGNYYTYVAVLPATDSEGNPVQLAEGVSLPRIRVTIMEKILTSITQLWVGTTKVVDGGVLQSTTSGTGWSYDSATQTLSLNGANITVTGITGAGESFEETSMVAYGLYCIGDLKLVVSGTNTITASGGAMSKGIYVKKGNLYVIGNDSLDSLDILVVSGVNNGITVSTANIYDNQGGLLDVSGDVRLTGEATLEGSKTIYGINADEIAVSDTATLVGHAHCSYTNYGILCTKGNITVGSNATMIARADDGYSGDSGQSYGLSAGDNRLSKGRISVEGSLAASAGEAKSRGKASGIYLVNTDLIVTGNGSVLAECLDPASTNESTYGLRVNGAYGEQIRINGGGFQASGGTGAVYPASTRVTINKLPIKYETSINRDGTNPTVYNTSEEWEEINGNFSSYRYIKATSVFDVKVNGTQVERVNMHDVLGDGTVSYQPTVGASPARLVLNGLNIAGALELDGTTEVALIGESSVGTIDTIGAVHVIGDGALSVTGELDCGSSELTIATASELTIQGTVTAGELVNNGTLISEGAAQITLSNITNNGSFTNTGNLAVTGDFIGAGQVSNTGRMNVTGTFTDSGTIMNEGVLILPEATQELIVQRIAGEGLNEVKGNSGAVSTFYINGTRLKAILYSMNFTKAAGAGLGGWSASAVLDDDGYQWDVDSKKLHLKNLIIRSTDDYAMMVPDGTTVVLEGSNVIDSEGDYGIQSDGELSVQGNGIVKSNNPRVEVLYAGQLIITDEARVTINGISNFEEDNEEPSVTVSDNAILISKKSIQTGSYTQEGNATVSVEETDGIGILTRGSILINGGNLTVRSNIMALAACATEARPGSILIGRGMRIANPSGAKLANATLQVGGMSGMITSVIAGNEASLLITLGSKGGVTGANTLRELVITRKLNQAALNIANIGTKTYGDGSFTLSTTGGSGTGDVTFTSSDSTIVSISGEVATIHKAGTLTITATKAEDSLYNEATGSITLTVEKKLLTVRADNKENITKGAVMPELTYVVTGLAGTDTFTAPTISATTADSNTVGEYDINISGGTLDKADSYTVTYVSGRLSVVNPYIPPTYTPSTESDNKSDKTPDIIDGSKKQGWDTVQKKLQQQDKKDESNIITIAMNGSATVPQDVLESLRGKDTTLVFDMGDGITWSINGQSVTDGQLQDVDLGVTLNTDRIPSELISQMAGEQSSTTLSLAYDGPFGFTAVLTIDLNKVNSGRYGNLFYYDPVTKQLTLKAVSSIGKEGELALPFDHASDYVVIVSDEPMLEKALDQITISSKKDTLYIGGTEKKSMLLTLELPQPLREAVEKDSKLLKVTYQSSNPKVATVNASGKITARKAGKTTITTRATINGAEKIFKTVVTVKKAYIKITKAADSLAIGDTFTYEAIGYGFRKEDILFYTSKKSIVVINKTTGEAKARTKGEDYIIAKARKVKVKIKVMVS